MSLILHLRPFRVPVAAMRFTLTFGLGGMALVLFLLLVFSGVLMMFAYEPTPDRAWYSIVEFQQDTLFGELIRGIHYWSANLLIPIAVLHLCRVFLTGGFQGPRRSNWLVGLGTLFFLLLSGFTGYLLPWDQTAYWAITICTEMMGHVPGIGPLIQNAIIGGDEIGAATTINFYALHVAVTPIAVFSLLSWHFWLIRTAGGVVLPRGPGDDPQATRNSVPFDPDLLLREAVVASVLIAIVLVAAMVFGAPLGDPANPGISPNPTKAPWYFLGVQELLIHFDGLFAVVLIPLCVTAGLILVAFLPPDEGTSGNWFLTPKGRRMSMIAALTALIVVPLFVLIDDRVIGTAGWLPGTAAVISHGLVPFAVVLAGISIFYVAANRFFSASKSELVQLLFVFLFVAFGLFTATGIWFRGAGMSLVWPWQI